MSNTKINNSDIKQPINTDIVLGSGVNIDVSSSGASNIGSAANPIGTVYANNINLGTGLTGAFVHKSGDNMSGTLTMGSGANIVAGQSGNNVGQPSFPFQNAYVNNVIANNVVPSVSGQGNIGTAASPYGSIYVTTLSGLQAPSFLPEDPFFRYNQEPLLNNVNNAYITSVTGNVFGATNYGCWDGENYWIGSFATSHIAKINSNGSVLNSYFISGTNPLELAWDGRNIWVGSADVSGKLAKFDTVTETVVATYTLNPSGFGDGGVQGVLWDGANIWAGVAQSGYTGVNAGFVAQINPSDGSVLQTIINQPNVNGLAVLDIQEPDALRRYVFSACAGSISKINATGGTYTSIAVGPTTYRICTDGTYIYGAEYFESTVYKILASTGQVKAIWQSAYKINDIEFDGRRVWVVGDGDLAHDGVLWSHDRDTGDPAVQMTGCGVASVTFDGSYMWTIDYLFGNFYKINIGEIAGNNKSMGSFTVLSTGNSVAFEMSTKQSAMLMNGNNILSVGNALPQTSGVSDIGSTGLYFDHVYSNAMNVGIISGLIAPPILPEDPFYRYNQQPTLNWVNNVATIFSTGVVGAKSYGCWDGENFWIGAFGNHTINKIDQNGVLLNTYTLASNINPLQLAWDNRYIWVASADTSGNLVKFDPQAGSTVATYTLNPSGLGAGGLQGVIWDGANIWAGVAQSGYTGVNAGMVVKVDPSSGSVLQTTYGQTNLNEIIAMDIQESNGLNRYIFAAHQGAIGKINASDGSYVSIPSPGETTYRICTDGYYIYGADFLNSVIYKFLPSNGAVIDTWSTGYEPNAITFDGERIWTAGNDDPGNDGVITVHNRDNGYVAMQTTGIGLNSLTFDGSYMWTVDFHSNVRKISIGEIAGNSKSYNSFTVINTGNQVAFSMSTINSHMNYHGNGITGVSNIMPSGSGLWSIGSINQPFSGINGVIYQPTVKITGNYTANLLNSNILTNQISPIVIGLPTTQIGKEYRIISTVISSGNTVTISGIGCSIDGFNIKTISSAAIGGSSFLLSDGSNYFTFSSIV